jgi:hypothetical protein
LSPQHDGAGGAHAPLADWDMQSCGRKPAAFGYAPNMSSVADQLRAESQGEERRLTPAERVERAQRLGELALAAYQAARRVDRQTALAALDRQRQAGRRPSKAAGGG